MQLDQIERFCIRPAIDFASLGSHPTRSCFIHLQLNSSGTRSVKKRKLIFITVEISNRSMKEKQI